MNTQADHDLFGILIDPHHGRKGRPRHKPTDAMRERVRKLREGGATLPTIAAALHITEPTLALHYREQLGWRRRSIRSAAGAAAGEESMSNKVDRVRAVVLRTEPHCRVCAHAGQEVRAVTIAPIVPLDMGGRMARRNLQPVCARHIAPLAKAPALARILRRRLRQKAAEARDHKGEAQ
jgi:hypothetical protein